jgi:hypothetical protein
MTNNASQFTSNFEILDRGGSGIIFLNKSDNPKSIEKSVLKVPDLHKSLKTLDTLKNEK